MVKIIKNSMTEPINIQCEHCKSELQYNYEDIQRRELPSFFLAIIQKDILFVPFVRER